MVDISRHCVAMYFYIGKRFAIFVDFMEHIFKIPCNLLFYFCLNFLVQAVGIATFQ